MRSRSYFPAQDQARNILVTLAVFTSLTLVIYFDHNATCPLLPEAREAWIAATERFIGNPSSPHRLGSRAEAALTTARQGAASHLGCAEFDLVWTSGATESNNAVFFHAAERGAGEAWVSAIEHPSVLEAAQRWFPQRVRLLPVNSQGELDLNYLADQLHKSRPTLVATMAANNETGVLQPWREALHLCHKHDVPFACDAAQWIGKEPSEGLGQCDFVAACAHKFGGPPGVGLLKVPSGFRSLIVGGPQEERRRAGTENVPGVYSFSTALAECEKRLTSSELGLRIQWREQFIQKLLIAVPGVEILGHGVPRLWNTVAALMPTVPDCRRRWVVQLDKLGFAVSTGSACASGKEKPSHVLTAMGREAKGDRMLRFSAGWETTEDDWRMLAQGAATAFGELSRRS